jgi:hypothetical protein
MTHVSHWTFPEIALTISMCSQHMSNPGEEHWDYLVWILDYVYTNKDSERLFTRCNGGLRTYFGYCDADYAGDPDSLSSLENRVLLLPLRQPHLPPVQAPALRDVEHV